LEIIRIEDAGRHVGATVAIQGWLTHRRSSGKVQFLVIRDGSGLGVFAPQWGVRNGIYAGVKKEF
jgi:aspartyl/asparaginyl-tRNA synthetase